MINVLYMATQTEIIATIAKHLGVTPQDIDVHSSLTDDLSLGPIEISDLLNELANRFQVAFSAEDIEQVKTVNDLVLLIEDLSLE